MNDLLPKYIDDINMDGMDRGNDHTDVQLMTLLTKLTHWRILLVNILDIILCKMLAHSINRMIKR